MKKNYKIIQTPFGNTTIEYEENGFLYSIPSDPANSDYQAYLKSLEAAQSTPNIPEGEN
jgi:hypothetical protein